MQWAKYDHDYSPVSDVVPNIPPGVYEYGMMGIHQIKPRSDVIIKTGLAAEIAADLGCFLANADMYEKLGFLHKRGYLLIGYPGTGKTITANQISDSCVGMGGVVFYPRTPDHATSFTRIIRRVHDKMPICLIFEEIEDHFDEDREELLSLLDGKNSTDHLVCVGTTNNPEKLDPALTDRPCRFDVVRWVGPPEASVRRQYLRQVIPAVVKDETIDELVGVSDGMLLSHLRDLTCSVLIQGKTAKDAANDIRIMMKMSSANEVERKRLAELEQKLPPSLVKQLKDQTKAIVSMATAA